ncbi:uncharacterized protein PFLUO_LOCUS9168 [Penicillium psychrofluorescens]|uniref:uncharacterized protein n=1 Tax=Penicillium psychrofluorescens TaxID=3158075 RepID=UPI003CCDC3E0
MNHSPTDVVIAAFKERGLSVKPDVIESALRDNPKQAEWVSTHLRPDTLFYSKLERSGSLQTVLHDPALGATRAVLEDDLRCAIESLEASTAAIQRQTQTLASQCEQLNEQIRLENDLAQNRSRDIARLRKKHEAGRQNTTAAASELYSELEISFTDAMDRASAENKRILSSLSTRLKQDDKTLAGLEALISGVKSHGNNASTVKRASRLTTQLAVYVAEEIHFRLDRMFLETVLAGDSALGCGTGGDDETVAALEEELESLYPEIEVLADMSTKQKFTEPILREIQNEHSQIRAASQQKLEQALDLLIEMTLSSEEMTVWLGEHESSCETLEQLAALYRTEVSKQPGPQPSSRRDSLRRRSLQPSVLFSNARNPSSPVLEQSALQSLLRRIGVSPESVLRPRAEEGGTQALHEKRAALSETLRNIGIAVDSPLVAHLGAGDVASQLLVSSLHSNSHFETSLPDPDEARELSGIEADLGMLQKGIQRVNSDVLHQRDKNYERFVERWT